ncbi:MAG: tetratricopeptide repeat protein [Nanoarchaeota archaeon]|nr:tetratricopeptide repeat protein [Nanoarchaeota archaeon]
MRKKQIFIAAIVGLITFLVYLPALQNGFVNWDDDKYVTENPHIQSLDLKLLKWAFFEFYHVNWHPLTNISYAIDYAIGGLNPFGYHLVNNIFHSLNTFLVVLLSVQILTVTGRLSDKAILMASAITGLLFGIHPIHVESVAWVSERKDVLCAFFFILSLMSYIRYAAFNQENPPQSPFGKRGFYLLSLTFFILALMSKPMAVTLPVVMLILDWHPLGRLNRETIKVIFIEKIPFFALSIASSIVTTTIMQVSSVIRPLALYPLSKNILLAGNAFFFYLYKIFYPDVLSPFYPYPEKIISLYYNLYLPALIIATITVFCILYKNKKALLAVFGCYFIMLFPVLGIVPIGLQIAADRYTYLPSISIFLLVGACLVSSYYLINKKVVKTILAIFSIILFSGMIYKTEKQIQIWKDDITLWSHAIKALPDAPENYHASFIMYNKLVLAYKKYRSGEDALNKANEAFQLATSLSLKYARIYNNLGIMYQKKGMLGEAVQAFEAAVLFNPYHAEIYNNLGIIYMERGMIDKAIGNFQAVLRIYPNYADVHFYLGMAYAEKGMTGEAARHYQEVIRLNPNDEAARNNLNRILQGKR